MLTFFVPAATIIFIVFFVLWGRKDWMNAIIKIMFALMSLCGIVETVKMFNLL